MTTELSVYLEGGGEAVIKVRIDDEAAGMFIIIEQDGAQIKIDPDEWPHVSDAVERMIKEIMEHEVSK
jgi:hypothetical protein